MQETKPWWQSTTIWSAVATIAALAVGLLGYTVTPEDQAELIQLISNAVAIVTGGYTLVGRVTATKKIGK